MYMCPVKIRVSATNKKQAEKKAVAELMETIKENPKQFAFEVNVKED
jgi:hypothetical protein